MAQRRTRRRSPLRRRQNETKFGSSTAFSIKSKVSRFTRNLLLNCSFVPLWYPCCHHRQSLCSTGPFPFRSFVDEQTTAAAIFWIEFSSSNKIFRALEPPSLLLKYSMLLSLQLSHCWQEVLSKHDGSHILFFATSPDRPKLFLSYFILQFTLVATLRPFPVLNLY